MSREEAAVLLQSCSYKAAVLGSEPSPHACPAPLLAAQVPLGFVLPTLLAWRAQLRTARANAAEWRGRGPQDVAAAAEAELQSSEYERVCAPALKAAAYWGWPITLALAGLAGFIAALLRFDPDAP